jgi:hypothetical protein
VAVLGAFGAALELAGTLPFLLARPNDSAPRAYLLVMAILSAVGLGLGVLRHYWDIYTHRSVRGISFIFVGLDAAGDLTSLLSVGKCSRYMTLTLADPCSFSVIVRPIDVEGSAIYAVELALWIGIMWLGVVYNLREWFKSRRAMSTTDAPAPEATTSTPEDLELTENGRSLERLSTSSSSASSVFQTVGLRKRAKHFVRRANRPKVCTPP